MQEEGSLPSERSGEGGAEAEVCTSEARKIRVPLARARGGASQEGLVSLLGAERMRLHFVVAVAMGPALRAGTRSLRNSTRGSSSSPCFKKHSGEEVIDPSLD